ncbi:hypothetical protein ACWCPQ_25160 [Nocardia sp. NPDC001965]
MTWPAQPPTRTDPAYYVDAESATEAQLRADFTHHYQLRLIAAYGETPADTIRMYRDASALADRWAHHENRTWRTVWYQLQGAVAGWEARPHATQRAFDRVARSRQLGGLPIDDMTWRTFVQACDITGHGPEPITGSEQDAAHSAARAPGPHVVVEAEPGSLLRRAFGPGFLDPATEAPTADELQQLDQRVDALRRLQDATAAHSRLADDWSTDSPPGRQILRLEQLLAAARTARRDAARAGASSSEIDQTYQAGLTGAHWHEQPRHPPPARVAHLAHERDDAVHAGIQHTNSASPAVAASGGEIDVPADDLPIGDEFTGNGVDAAIAAVVGPTGQRAGDWELEADHLDASPVTAEHSAELF